MAYRNKTYIAFDGDRDMEYYRLMTAWSANNKLSLNIFNAHDLNTARDSSQESSIKAQLRKRFANSKLFIVLIGENTWRLTKFVKWEIETAIRLDLPIIGINLNGSRIQDGLCPPAMREALAIYMPFKEKVISHASVHWPGKHVQYKAEGKSGAFVYNDAFYKGLGL
ncbi:TIR domain-containing protein [Burkholderia gladioli]|uniref:TIR domain-containing protein n=1 Tax=Burkholderia gladioli TaxID=28095 RepID=UPI00264C17EC|nr:TIR domain-containing protein [Burkholderia gladioli]MDN7715118.1 TIR domain-containing protein [Burkholderia gladioli]